MIMCFLHLQSGFLSCFFYLYVAWFQVSFDYSNRYFGFSGQEGRLNLRSEILGAQVFGKFATDGVARSWAQAGVHWPLVLKIHTQMAQGPSFGTFGFDFFFARAFERTVISGHGRYPSPGRQSVISHSLVVFDISSLIFTFGQHPALGGAPNIQSQPYHFHPKWSRERANQLGLQMKKRQFLTSQRRTLQKSILPWHWAMMEQLFESTFLDSCCLE